MRRIGMLTPSANTSLEPVTSAIIGSVPDCSVHYSRFRVTRIGLDADAMAQFDTRHLIEAARLLADAAMDVIAWNGSSGSWLPNGKALDANLCDAIQGETAIRATTMTFAVWDAFRALGIRRYSLVTPFTDDETRQIVRNYEEEGFNCLHFVNLPFKTTLERGRATERQIGELIRSAAYPGADGIAVICTNLKAAPLLDELERELGVPIVDSIAATAWKSLEMVGNDRPVTGWGRLLYERRHVSETGA